VPREQQRHGRVGTDAVAKAIEQEESGAE